MLSSVPGSTGRQQTEIPRAKNRKISEESQQNVRVRAIRAKAQFILYTVTPYDISHETQQTRISFLVHQSKVSQAPSSNEISLEKKRSEMAKKERRNHSRENRERPSLTPTILFPTAFLPTNAMRHLLTFGCGKSVAPTISPTAKEPD